MPRRRRVQETQTDLSLELARLRSRPPIGGPVWSLHSKPNTPIKQVLVLLDDSKVNEICIEYIDIIYIVNIINIDISLDGGRLLLGIKEICSIHKM